MTDRLVLTPLGMMKVAYGFNIYVDVTAVCNAHCPFCIAPIVDRRDGPKFFNGVEFALDLAERTNGSIQIVGGEPTISKRLPRLLDMLRSRQIVHVVLNTNAAGITNPLIVQCLAAGVEYINISRHHDNEVENQRIMQQRPLVSNRRISEIVLALSAVGIGVRLNCNLISDGISNLNDVIRYLDWGERIGVNVFSFSQLFPLSLFDYQRPPVLGYTESHQVDLMALVSALDNSPDLSPARPDTPNMCAWGSNWARPNIGDDDLMPHRRFWKNKSGALLSIKTLGGYGTDGVPLPSVYDKSRDAELAPDMLAIAVVQSDGKVTAGWDKRERILFDPDSEMDFERTQNLFPANFAEMCVDIRRVERMR